MNYVQDWYVRSWYIRKDSDVIDWIIFDKYGKHIYLNESITRIDLSVVYSRAVDWITIDENAKIKPPMKYSGYDPIPWGFTGATFFMYNDWKLVFNPNVTAIEWVLFSEDYDTWYWSYDKLPIYPITVAATVNTVYKEMWVSWLTEEESIRLLELENTDLTITNWKIDDVNTTIDKIFKFVKLIFFIK